MFACPRCHSGLFVGHASDITMHACGQCGGLWLDSEAALKVRQALPQDALDLAAKATEFGHEKADTQAEALCPVCRRPMQRAATPAAGVDIDYCSHGTWFDRGELEQIARVLRQKATPAARVAPPPGYAAGPPPGYAGGPALGLKGAAIGVAAVGAAAAVATVAPQVQASPQASNLMVSGADLATGGADLAAGGADLLSSGAGFAAEVAGTVAFEVAADVAIHAAVAGGSALAEGAGSLIAEGAGSALVEGAGEVAAAGAGIVVEGIFALIGGLFS
jgi:Zn-finger nucleic acid-binding protein